MLILHIVRDEKFIDNAVRYFELAYEGMNQLLVLERDSQEQNSFIKSTIPQARYPLRDETDLAPILKETLRADLLVFHGMDLHQARIVNSLPPGKHVLWLYLGFEVYNQLPEFAVRNLGRETARIAPPQMHRKLFYLKWWLNHALGRFHRAPVNHRGLLKAMNRAQWFGSFLSEDWDYIRSVVPLKCKRIWFMYYDIEAILGELMNASAEGQNIWLGNSATPENNHVEALEILSKMDLSGGNIICPLSYGNPNYAQRVVEVATRLVPGKFMALKAFMPRNEYNKFMLTCSGVVMNHRRQQAVGNVVTALWLGCRLFMSEKSTVYQQFKNMGLHLYSVENDLRNWKGCMTSLSEQERGHNRKILLKEYTHNAVSSRMHEALKEILEA